MKSTSDVRMGKIGFFVIIGDAKKVMKERKLNNLCIYLDNNILPVPDTQKFCEIKKLNKPKIIVTNTKKKSVPNGKIGA